MFIWFKWFKKKFSQNKTAFIVKILPKQLLFFSLATYFQIHLSCSCFHISYSPASTSRAAAFPPPPSLSLESSTPKMKLISESKCCDISEAFELSRTRCKHGEEDGVCCIWPPSPLLIKSVTINNTGRLCDGKGVWFIPVKTHTQPLLKAISFQSFY